MLGQVTIATDSPNVLRPLLQAALQNEAKAVAHGIKRTQERLTAFEKRYGMSSDEFEHRFTAVELGETLDFIDWLGEIKMLRVLKEQKLALDGARVK